MRMNEEDMRLLESGGAFASVQQRAYDEIEMLRAELSAIPKPIPAYCCASCGLAAIGSDVKKKLSDVPDAAR